MTFSLTSSKFLEGERIPRKYTCDGDNLSPPLTFGCVPEETKSLALIMEDSDLPRAVYPDGGVFDHWILFNIPSGTADLVEGTSIGIGGSHSGGKIGYTGPCPPAQYEPKEHRYFFHVYALDAALSLEDGATKSQVLSAMDGHILAAAELMGRYARE